MLEAIKDEIARLRRRILLSVVQGIVNIVNDTPGIQIMQVGLGSGYIRDNTPRMQEYGFTSNPPSGGFAIVLSAGGNISDAVVIATDDPRYRPINLNSGEAKMYDNVGKFIYLSAAGIIIDAAGSPVTIENASTVTINASGTVTVNTSADVVLNTPLLKVSGDIIDNYGTNTHTIGEMRTLYNEHYHGGVMSGGSNTDTPDNSM